MPVLVVSGNRRVVVPLPSARLVVAAPTLLADNLHLRVLCLLLLLVALLTRQLCVLNSSHLDVLGGSGNGDASSSCGCKIPRAEDGIF